MSNVNKELGYDEETKLYTGVCQFEGCENIFVSPSCMRRYCRDHSGTSKFKKKGKHEIIKIITNIFKKFDEERNMDLKKIESKLLEELIWK